MGDKKTSTSDLIAFNARMTREDIDRLKRLQTRMQEEYGPSVRVTLRTVIIEATAKLEAYYEKLDRDRERKR